MEQYISKAALVSEIERRRDDYINSFMTEQVHVLNDVLDFLNTLEVKEVQKEPVSIWHDAKEPPEMYRKYFARYSDGRINGSWERHDDGFIPWKDVIKEHNITHWCYVEDLLKL